MAPLVIAAIDDWWFDWFLYMSTLEQTEEVIRDITVSAKGAPFIPDRESEQQRTGIQEAQERLSKHGLLLILCRQNMEEGVDFAYELYWANEGILYLPCLPHKRHHSKHLLQAMDQRLPALNTRLIDQHNTEAWGVHSVRSYRLCKADFDGNLWVDGAHRYLAVKQHQLVRLSQDVPCSDV